MNLSKNVRFFGKLIKAKISGTRIPLTVIFNVTNRCNSSCRHCYAEYYSRDNSREMTTEDAKKLISELYNNGCRRISFSGGEPLLREDITDLLEYTDSLGMSITLNTNGILVPQYLPVLKKLDSLAVSLDGRPEHHDILRGLGTGRLALEGIKKAAGYGIRVHSNTVLNRYNLEDIDYILDLARKHGFKAEFALAISNIFGEGLSADEFKPTNGSFRNALRYIIQKKKEGAPILFSVSAYQSVLNCWNDFSVEGIINAPAPEGMPTCPAGRFFCLIDADGALWACPHLIGKMESRNALYTGVLEAWRIAGNHSCTGCYQIYHHEFSMLMNLNPKVVWNYFKMSVGKN